MFPWIPITMTSIAVDFVRLKDNVYSLEFDDNYSCQIVGDRVDCFAHKLVFSDGSTTFDPLSILVF